MLYVSENFNGDDTDDLLRPVKQWQARQELKDLSKVSIRGLLSRSEGGWWMGGKPAFGYDLAYCDSAGKFLSTLRYMPDGSKQVLDEAGTVKRVLAGAETLLFSKNDRCRLVLSEPARVKAVQRIFELYVRGGLGYKGIADRLNREGIPSAHRNGWGMTSVREIVLNPVYAGERVWNRRSYAKFNRIQRKQATAVPSLKPLVAEFNDEADWIVSRDTHPPIISRKVAQAARARRLERRKHFKHNFRRGRGATSDYLLTGVIRCGGCGHHWQGRSIGKGRRNSDGTRAVTQYYACNGYITKGKAVCRTALSARSSSRNSS